MNGFRFPLQQVLSWRETQLSIEEAHLERLRLEKNMIESAIADLAAWDARESEVLYRVHPLTGGDVFGIASTREWIAQEEKRLRLRIADCLRAMEARTAAVTEARRRVRLIQKLKERRQASWNEEMNRQSEELAGDAAIAGWRRRHAPSAEPNRPAASEIP
jgi:hypothetical protein